MAETSTPDCQTFKKPHGIAGLLQSVEKNGEFLTGRFDDYRLMTALQPIYSLAHQRVVGYEALLRAFDSQDRPVTPGHVFSKERPVDDLIHLDDLTRFLHVHNYRNLEDEKNWLFLNVSPATIQSRGDHLDTSFRNTLEYLGIPPARVVIEVVEQPFSSDRSLRDAVSQYRDLGCLVAIDDFGTGYSNFNRIWSLRPDIVKLDRSFLTQAAGSASVRNTISGIVSLLHQIGSLVLIEGIETEDQAMIAIESDADFVQGYYFGRPDTSITPQSPKFDGFPRLFDRYRTASSRNEQSFQDEIHQYRALFTQAIDELKNGRTLEKASRPFFLNPFVVRTFLIGVNGIQIGNTQVAPGYASIRNNRFAPLEDTASADWIRRHYLKRAVLHPDQLQVTRPYLSITGAHMCITLSFRFSGAEGDAVLCCDILTGRNPALPKES